MGPVFLAITISLLVYIVAVTFIPRHVLYGSGTYTRHMINRLREQNFARGGERTPLFVQDDDPGDNPLVRAFLLMPGMQRAVPLIQRADIWRNLDQFVLAILLIFLFLLFVASRLGLIAIPLALAGTWLLALLYLRRRVGKRSRAFLEQFPDAIDSIVRSVRAGYPLNTAIAMIGDNMPAPIGVEFKRVADEAAYGLSLFDALSRMAERVNEPDVHFFSVVLAVQQESGGNLSEVLSNLSSVLRKRRQLRLKIRALSSEGRATAWILGALPVFVFGVIYLMSPEHLTPLFTTGAGHLILAAVVGLVATGMLIVRQIINMEV